jgi:uncharacterized protein
MRAYRLLRKHRLSVDLLCVVHARNVQYPLEVYRFFREIGAQYLSFIPLVEPRSDSPGGVSERTVPPLAFGDFLCAIFDEWFRQDIGRIVVQSFEEAARPAFGLDHSLCIFRPTCGDFPVVEHNGDFSCDHFVTLTSAKPRSSASSRARCSEPGGLARRCPATASSAMSEHATRSRRTHHPDTRRQSA